MKIRLGVNITDSIRGGVKLRLNILDNLITMVIAINRLLVGYVSRFREALLLMISVFLVRAYIGGNVMPVNTRRVVNAIASQDLQMLIYGAIIYFASGVVHIATEFILQRYFVKLAEGIVKIKLLLLNNLNRVMSSEKKLSLEDLVGRISSDVDFVVWNLNVVLTTFIPNIFTAVTAIATLLSFDTVVGLCTAPTLIPYIFIAEYYSRRAEKARFKERQAYSQSIVHIRDAVYGAENGYSMAKILNLWKESIVKVMWYDRVYWGTSLITMFSSIGLASYIVYNFSRDDRVDVGTVAGILTAISTGHSAFMNAVWALCIQSQTVAAVKRILECIGVDQKTGEKLIAVYHGEKKE
jgi:ABC-type multidrug transport system fused ATPase/permease subunit